MLYSFLGLNRVKKKTKQTKNDERGKKFPSPGEGGSVRPVLDSVWGSCSHCKGFSLCLIISSNLPRRIASDNVFSSFSHFAAVSF